MISIRPTSRTAVSALVLVVVAATSGCAWFRNGNDLYTQDAESRPLEVPPDLDLPQEGGAAAANDSSVTASGKAAGQAPGQAPAAPPPPPAAAAEAGAAPAPAAAPPAGAGFSAPGTRADVFAQVEQALQGIDGVDVASSAELLGVFDVNYQGSNFLVRVSESEAGTAVSAVDARGMPATGDAPTALLAALQGAIGSD